LTIHVNLLYCNTSCGLSTSAY